MVKGRGVTLGRRVLGAFLAAVMAVSGIGVLPGGMEAKAAEPISISSAEQLAQIGTDGAYPLDGDYVLTADIDLSGEGSWTPIGGGVGERGSFTGSNVFSGTFDGGGHIISGLTIDKKESVDRSLQYGLFGMVGSGSAADKASVKNLILAEADICVDLSAKVNDAYLSLGALAGEVNRNAVIDNVAVVGGAVSGNPSNGGDVVGVGGLIGEMRPNTFEGTENNVSVSNVFVSADVSSGSSTDQNYVAGVVGRIAKANPSLLKACVFTGEVSFKGSAGYGISGGDMTENASNCYFRSGLFNTGALTSQEELTAGTLLDGLQAEVWKAAAGSYLTLAQCAGSKALEDILFLSSLSLNLAKGDTPSSVTGDFTVPTRIAVGGVTEELAWSSDQKAIAVGADGAVKIPTLYADMACTLTAVTSSGKKKAFRLTLKANASQKLIAQEYATVGEPLSAELGDLQEGMSCAFEWSVGGALRATGDTYTPSADDLMKMLTVTAKVTDADGDVAASFEEKMYVSKLPVVYIDTKDGAGITDKENYKDASMRIQGNGELNSGSVDLYDGEIEIRGRGNSTWNLGYSKLPYKIKLKKKTNLMGFGNSKHWALLANYMDESLLRNKTSYDLSGKMGMGYLKSAHVDVILNGRYAGNYQLVGNVRVDKSRVNIYDWEGLAGDVAEAVAEQDAQVDAGGLEDYLNEHMQWVTSGSFSYNGTDYAVSDYYKGIPQNADGDVDISGGFLIELDEYFDEVSKFKTKNDQPIMLKSPEFIQTNDDMFRYAKQYIQAVEDSVRAADFCVDIAGDGKKTEGAADFQTDYAGKKHYSQLVDMESLVRYLVLNEFYWNTETMKKSTYMYKDLGGKLYIGPVWDMDWTSNSLVSQNETWNPNVWMVKQCAQNNPYSPQSKSWYTSLIGDPLFAERMLECYQENREHFAYIIDTEIDEYYTYLKESGDENYKNGYLLPGSRMSFREGTNRLKTFLKSRLSWLDQQFASLPSLLQSLGKYRASGRISVAVKETEGEDASVACVAAVDAGIEKVAFYVNGIQAGVVEVSGQKAELAIDAACLTKKAGEKNVVQAYALDASGNLLGDGKTAVGNYVAFDKALPAQKLEGTVTIEGAKGARVGSVLTAKVDSNNTGVLLYQWKADGTEISGAVYQAYTLTEKEQGKAITVEVTSSVETGGLEGGPTDPIKGEIQNDHLLIHQVFGGGANDGASISHSFIELYNPTDAAVSLSGYRIGYYSGRQGSPGYTEKEVYLQLDGQKEIPARHSYLIRCEAQQPAEFNLTIDAFDQEWENQTIANKRYRVILYNGAGEAADGVSVNEEAVEGEPLLDPPNDEIVSKHKSVRRKNFADTDNNSLDFEAVSYRADKITPEALKANAPRTLSDGAWGEKEENPDPAPLSGQVSIRGNAIVGAALYADEATNNTGELSYQWKLDGVDIAGATGQFYLADASAVGKKVSVTVTSSVESGSLTASMENAVKSVAAQRTHLIVNQAYGHGGKEDGPASHSFIELYNPTSALVDLSGHELEYQSKDKIETLTLKGVVPARSSYLVRCAAAVTKDAVLMVKAGDQEWDLTVDNKRYSVALKKGGAVVDGLSVNEAPVEGSSALTDPEGDTVISKNKSVRRIGFIDTDDNVSDFETLNFSKLPKALLEGVRPRSVSDGAWGLAAEQGGKPGTPGGGQNEGILPDPGNQGDKELKVGSSFRQGKAWYQVTKLTKGKKEVSYVKPWKKTYKKVQILPTVKKQGVTFQVTSIGKGAFKGNRRLEEVTIGKNVKTIGANAFSGDKKLRKVAVKSSVLKTVGKNAFQGVSPKCKVSVPKKKRKAYRKKFKKMTVR